MKCPKCGNEMVKDAVWNKYPKAKFICINEDCEKIYQHRLDKVLSNPKFKEVGQGNDHLVYKIIWYSRIEKKFFIYNTSRYFISLETVESLLKDLEEEEK